MFELSRRNFLSQGAAGVSTAMLTSLARGDAPVSEKKYAVVDEVAFRGQTRRLKLMQGDRYMAALIFPTDYPTHFRLKPELYPVCTPSGVPVTDTHQYCFIHHQSIMTGHGKVHVDGTDHAVDFYRQLPDPNTERIDKFHKIHNLFQMGPSGIQKIIKADWKVTDHIQLRLILEWQLRDKECSGGKPVISEQRRYNLFQRGPYTIIDQFTQLSPHSQSLTLKADRHSLMGVRVNDLIDPDDGGMMHDSEKRKNPDGNYWDASGKRKAPRWIDCTGRIGNQTAGIALFSHPNNNRNEFYSRGWGLMILSPTLGHDVRVTKDKPLQFAARFVAHDGALAGETAEELSDEFAAVDYRKMFETGK